MEEVKVSYPSSTPVNTKSLLAFIFGQMGKLDRKEITASEAMAQAKLSSQASNLLNYELKRTMVQIKLQEIGKSLPDEAPVIREIESKKFDNTLNK